MARRTVMRSSTGTKLYAVRDAGGKFKDIQTYKRAHAADLRHKSADELAAAKKPSKKPGKKRVTKKTAKKVVKTTARKKVAKAATASKKASRKKTGARK